METFLNILTYVGYIVVALLCLMFMIVIHESGHYATGKLLGFKINEFSIGFGPAIFKRKNKKTGELFAVRVIPLGGYCAFDGEEDAEEKPKEGSFNAMAPWKRIIVFFAGAFFNFVSAIIIISLFFMIYGDFMPKVTQVYELAGVEQVLQEGDEIIAVNGRSLYNLLNANDVVEKLQASGDSATLTVIRDGKEMEITAHRGNYTPCDKDGNPSRDEEGNIIVKSGYGIGIGEFVRYKFGFFESIGRAFVFSFKVVGTLFSTIGKLFTGALAVKGSLGGPISTITAIATVTRAGFDAVMYVICVLSATLAITNLLPLPALDGSKIVFTLIEWIRKKPLNRKVENIIHTVGLIALFSLTILLDIINLV